MLKHLTSWIHQQSRPLILSGIAVVGVLGATYLTIAVWGKGNDTPTANYPQAPNAVATQPVRANGSLWDREIKPLSQPLEIAVYRSPSCGCCGEWIKHLDKHGFKITDTKTSEMSAVKEKYNVPQDLASCHTAIINGYAIEGHVPANDIKRLVKEKPDIAGIAVPGMPLGTPGMEAGERKESFAVLAFSRNGESNIFKDYQSY
ncbi:metal-binding protein [Moorena producens PAL-8-15-08-1]|uniref:Metal-binding protein n=1 Tax=Moorena producens PAL-8-15-08-1 TaxID=1458985 RepID=A0A1D8TL48_9CYAN|nr:DUF411 domain-containing protein [Moorena producens]AOW98333.1 metal-binding protein [Moorena producens PAL-8-15-08-1]